MPFSEPVSRVPSPIGPSIHHAVGLVVLVCGMAGCGASAERRVHPVAGRISVGDQVPVGAQVVLHPTPEWNERSGRPSAIVKPDGTFTVSTYRDADGAPEGDYTVTVQWFPVGPDGTVGVNAIDRRYASPQSSPLKVTVASGANELPPLTIASAKSKPSR